MADDLPFLNPQEERFVAAVARGCSDEAAARYAGAKPGLGAKLRQRRAIRDALGHIANARGLA